MGDIRKDFFYDEVKLSCICVGAKNQVHWAGTFEVKERQMEKNRCCSQNPSLQNARTAVIQAGVAFEGLV